MLVPLPIEDALQAAEWQRACEPVPRRCADGPTDPLKHAAAEQGRTASTLQASSASRNAAGYRPLEALVARRGQLLPQAGGQIILGPVVNHQDPARQAIAVARSSVQLQQAGNQGGAGGMYRPGVQQKARQPGDQQGPEREPVAELSGERPGELQEQLLAWARRWIDHAARQRGESAQILQRLELGGAAGLKPGPP